MIKIEVNIGIILFEFVNLPNIIFFLFLLLVIENNKITHLIVGKL